MQNNKKRATVIFTKDISETRLKEFQHQYNKIPKNWLRRFCEDEWQLAFTTDITISGNQNPNTFLVSDPEEKRVWINAKIAAVTNFPVYRAFLFYMQSEYGNLSQNEKFQKSYIREKGILSKITGLELAGVLPEEIFTILFIQFLEQPQIQEYKLSETCQYVIRWLNEDVFKVRTSILPEYLKIGTDVTEEQIFEIINAWNKIPQGIADRFLKFGWKIFLTNSREWRKHEHGRHVAGFITNESEEILIKASMSELDMTLFHEIGHFVHMITNNRNLIKDFYNAYWAEKDTYFSMYNDSYGISNVEEYFAQIFAHYVKHPEQIKNKLRKSYGTVDSIVGKYK